MRLQSVDIAVDIAMSFASNFFWSDAPGRYLLFGPTGVPAEVDY